MDVMEQLRAFRDQIDGDFVAGLEAQKFVTQMLDQHPDQFAEWMHARAVQYVTNQLAGLERHDRSRAIDRAVFDQAFETGDLSLFKARFVVDTENTRRPLGKMIGSELLFVAHGYEASSKHSLMMAAFMRALAKQAGDQPVESVMSEHDAEALLRQFSADRVSLLKAALAA